MPITIIIKDIKPKGRTRTSTDHMLKDLGWGSSFKTEEDADKCAFVERKFKKEHGADNSRIIAAHYNKVDRRESWQRQYLKKEGKN